MNRVCCSFTSWFLWFHGPTRSHPIIADNSNTMSTPALNLVAVCTNANLPVNGTKANYLKVLRESGAALGSSQTLPDIKERFAALTWVRHAVANAIDPATWPATLSTPLLDFLRSLYPMCWPVPQPPVAEARAWVGIGTRADAVARWRVLG